MDFESNTDILRDLMNQLHILHKENAKLRQEVEQLKEINSELNRKLKSIQALFL
jgi:predicted RNase H-like nuclease (RuvC/YqgF family)